MEQQVWSRQRARQSTLRPRVAVSPPQGVLQGHAAHLAEWSATLRPKGSWGTCIPQGVTTFFHTAFTAHRVHFLSAAASRNSRPVMCWWSGNLTAWGGRCVT